MNSFITSFKLFESVIDKDSIKEEVDGILVELVDDGFKPYIKYEDDLIQVEIVRENSDECFTIDDVYEYVSSLVEWMKVKYNVDAEFYTISSRENISGFKDLKSMKEGLSHDLLNLVVNFWV